VKVAGKHWRTIWVEPDGWSVGIIDQTLLPHRFDAVRLTALEDAARAIASMQVRGAPLIGATAAYGLCLALRRDASDDAIADARERLMATRPTAANLRWALNEVTDAVRDLPPHERVAAAYARAGEIAEQDILINRAIGQHGVALIEDLASRKPRGEPVNILTHCNAGWLATVDRGTASAPIYEAHERGIRVHVWVDETRPRNQGALTAWELSHEDVPHTLIVDNAGGHLMHERRVDLVLVGADRVAANGDVANKIGTYLKALAAQDNGVPFYVALPSPTIDFTVADGRQIPIEERGAEEVSSVTGRVDAGLVKAQIVGDGTPVANPGFDVTPARLVSGLITERGVIEASRAALAQAFPERAGAALARPAAE
jgi:methylthioribose-1-phosphate isomerase